MICCFASGVGRPSNAPELTSTPSPVNACVERVVQPSVGAHDLDDRQAELLRELEVALVVRRARP